MLSFLKLCVFILSATILSAFIQRAIMLSFINPQLIIQNNYVMIVNTLTV
jgi:hypothetical protein